MVSQIVVYPFSGAVTPGCKAPSDTGKGSKSGACQKGGGELWWCADRLFSVHSHNAYCRSRFTITRVLGGLV